MKFTFIYDGDLRTKNNPANKRLIREQLSPQFKSIWNLESVEEIETVKKYDFEWMPLARKAEHMQVKLDILMLVPVYVVDNKKVRRPPVITGGDIDNRLKNLLDALSIPQQPNQMKGYGPENKDEVLFTLIEDDALITGVKVEADRWLVPSAETYVRLVVRANVIGWPLNWNQAGRDRQ